jgi:hypothetical protein
MVLLNVQAKKVLKKEYYTKWDANELLTAFGKRLNDDQHALVCSDITITNNNKLQFYLEEIYNSNCFNKQEMLTWEQQPAATKTNYNLAQAYFERIIKATNTYEQNMGGETAGHNCYKSTNQMANYGNEIREYIQQLASRGAANTTDNASNVQTKEKMTRMEAKIKKLTATIAAMAAKMTNNENRDPNGDANGGGGSNCMSRQPQMTKIRNMGAYCSSHGFHLVSANHNSANCSWKKPKHNIATTVPTALAATCFGCMPGKWQSSNKIIPHGRESQPPPTDRDRGMH